MISKRVPLACLGGVLGMLLLLDCSTGVAKERYPASMFRGRVYTQFAIGPAITYYSLHRTPVDESSVPPDADDDKKWWQFIGAARNYDLSVAYVYSNGLILGGDVAVIRSRGMKGLKKMNVLIAPENPGETFSAMAGPVIGFFPKPNYNLYLLFQPSIGFSSLSVDAPAGSFRASVGYDWAAGPSGSIGLSLAFELQWTKSDQEGYRPSLRYDAVHLPLFAMVNVCFKGYWNRKK